MTISFKSTGLVVVIFVFITKLVSLYKKELNYSLFLLTDLNVDQITKWPQTNSYFSYTLHTNISSYNNCTNILINELISGTSNMFQEKTLQL